MHIENNDKTEKIYRIQLECDGESDVGYVGIPSLMDLEAH